MYATNGSFAAMSSICPETRSLDHVYRLAIYHRDALAVDPSQLGERERAWLAARDLTPARHDEWIRGRIAMHRILPVATDVLADADGAPRPAHHGWLVSLAHEGGWFAAACRLRTAPDASIAVGLRRQGEHARAGRALSRLRVALGAGIGPVEARAGLECALKLRKRNVFTLLGERAGLRVEAAREGLRVLGVGEPVRCRLHRPGPVVVAVGVDS